MWALKKILLIKVLFVFLNFFFWKWYLPANHDDQIWLFAFYILMNNCIKRETTVQYEIKEFPKN